MNAKIDYPYSVSGKSYDVVIYGDSSAMFGIDPVLVSDQIHVSTVNLSQTRGVLIIDGEKSLDAFLASNGKPKLLVLAVSPDSVSLDRDSPEHLTIDGWYAMVRRSSPNQIARNFAAHPRMMFALWSETLHQEFLTTGFLKRQYKKSWSQLQTHSGYFSYPVTNNTLRSCQNPGPDELDKLHLHSYLNHFKSKYIDSGYSTAIFFTPVPDCNPNLAAIRTSLAGMGINQPYSIPRSYFADDKQGNHALPAGTKLISGAFSTALQSALQRIR
jgi:hypothetical protein